LLLLSGQLLPSSDPAGLAASLANVSLSLITVKWMQVMDMDKLMKRLEEVLVTLEAQVTSWGLNRTVFLDKFQLCLLASKEVDQVDGCGGPDGQAGGQEAMSVMLARFMKFSMDQVTIKALLEAKALED
jgi:hypothetical protein